jgi:hypothetical protein
MRNRSVCLHGCMYVCVCACVYVCVCVNMQCRHISIYIYIYCTARPILTSAHHGLLRCIKALAHVSINVAEMEKMGISNDLQHSFEVANKQAIRDPHLMRSAQLFPVLKCAFCATDVSEILPFLPSPSLATNDSPGKGHSQMCFDSHAMCGTQLYDAVPKEIRVSLGFATFHSTRCRLSS